ncbi:DNA-3-methyladenine glycosylase I [Exilibacterium tricleocarpae]|uniref:DNA-3-methyladenine glycosylase I n=1 Tax=Exilibacterium tricleocarpae TaxID=2591008 RepID=A0A545T630_9GAMM|nr:DNA-3-methyladenine glycosylase I [Exilibacterium tricleocarpae]TQV72679.1 DNA-3-methyladenine glycosylase I [Exilibacterium tricleocarpae]
MTNKPVTRCEWCADDPLYQAYHDDEWGVPTRDDQTLFEFLLLEGAQAGLSWITILRKREGYRRAYDNFNAERMARYSDKKIERLLQNPDIVRNRLKVMSAVQNARAYLDILATRGSFSDFLWEFVDGKPVQNRWKTLADIPSSTEVSDAMSKQLKKLGFNFVGSTICYAFMQATGMVNDHTTSCHRYRQCKALA